MNKFSRSQITEYALYKYMKENVTNFDVIFNGNNIMNAILYRYDWLGKFNHDVLKLMPLIGLNWVTSEELLQELIDRLTDDTVESEFIQITVSGDTVDDAYYIKIPQGE